MRTKTKVWLIIAASLVLVGCNDKARMGLYEAVNS